MKNFFLLFMSVALIVLSVLIFRSPKIEAGLFLKPQFVDFGRVDAKAGVLKGRFSIVNQFASEIKVRNISVSCRCTKAITNLNPIPAYGSSEVDYELDLAGVSGQQVYLITITTDSTTHPKLDMRMMADVVPDSRQLESIYNIGHFPPSARIDVRVPLPDSAGIFELATVNDQEIQVDLNSGSSDIRVTGKVPESPGTFSFDIFLSSTGAEVQRSVGSTEHSGQHAKISVVGIVSSRWIYAKELYLGLIEGKSKPHRFEIVIEQKHTRGILPEVDEVRVVSSETDLVLEELLTDRDRITLNMQLNEIARGQHKSQIEVVFHYADTTSERAKINLYYLSR